ncbi:tyrosine-type recombinase/integrase [Bifidobacterium eulemuris]|uniref:Phage integrase family protein n=1 Tax=Bifidobacterium eulemuris TaxID=1765219 RepID=A0A261GA56_9BIFI|nr:tyrosine-type recombinase/integrase [Bifidobacterium eulemuris]OZG68294.1 phage integrase family protein [Bifidobacterium eulemuris]QOL31654.1 tyrosine-type recombinase/integrase [Bifidobacterium eulemuris]
MSKRSVNGAYKPFKTESGVWLGAVENGRYPNGRKRYKYARGNSKQECRTNMVALRESLKKGLPVNSSDTPRFGEYADRWLEHKFNEVRRKTYESYMTVNARHLTPLRPYPLNEITPGMVQSLIDNAKSYTQRGTENGPAGVSLKEKILTVVKQVYEMAVRDGLVNHSPVVAITIGKTKDMQYELERQAEAQSFSAAELMMMLQIADRMPVEQGAIWWWRLLTGMRQMEILGAQWSHLRTYTDTMDVLEQHEVEKTVDFTDENGIVRQGTITTTETIPVKRKMTVGEYTVEWQLNEAARVHGCGEPDVDGVYPCGYKKAAFCDLKQWRLPDNYSFVELQGRWILARPKSKTGKKVPIIPMLAAKMRQYEKATRDWPNPHGLIFRRPDGTPLGPKEDSAGFDRLMEMSGIDPELHRGHGTRHAMVTLLAQCGVDFQLIKEIVGHSSDAMVAHYRHAGSGERLRAMERVGERLNLTS